MLVNKELGMGGADREREVNFCKSLIINDLGGGPPLSRCQSITYDLSVAVFPSKLRAKIGTLQKEKG